MIYFVHFKYRRKNSPVWDNYDVGINANSEQEAWAKVRSNSIYNNCEMELKSVTKG